MVPGPQRRRRRNEVVTVSRTANGSAEHETEQKLTSKERYQKVLRVVEYQTTGPDGGLPAGARRSTVHQIACQYGYYDADGMLRAEKAAVAAGDLIPWRDREGRLRLTRTDESSLRDLIADENRRDDTCIELVERCGNLIEDPTVDGGDLGR